MKYAEVTSIHKKDDKTDKENYYTISIQIYSKHNQIYPYFHTIFTKFHKGVS